MTNGRIAVGVASRRGRTDEGSREGLVGMASSALGSGRFSDGLGYNIRSPLIYGNGLRLPGLL